MVFVADVCRLMRELAPEDTCESWDNVGLLIGSESSPVSKVLVALDFDKDVLDEALRMGAELVITHHPVIFRPMKNIRSDRCTSSAVFAAIRSGVSVYSAHTNLDNAHPGVNDALAAALELRDIVTDAAFPMSCKGVLSEEMDMDSFRAHVAARLGTPWVRFCGKRPDIVRSVVVLGGSGADYLTNAAQTGADVYLTGEIGYHNAQLARDMGLCVCEVGHYWSEHPLIFHLANHLQSEANALQYNIEFLCSGNVSCPYFT